MGMLLHRHLLARQEQIAPVKQEVKNENVLAEKPKEEKAKTPVRKRTKK